jgi:DtxR family Mn-dependent transcriptional regulator
LAPGAPATICRVLDDDPELLRYLSSLGMTLGVHVEVASRAPFDGPMHVRLEESPATHALGAHVTDQVFVEVQTAPAE